MGGISHKGSNGNGNRGRPHGLILLLAFGAALLGVMVVHKLRERRIFNLLVEEKNRQLVSLQLLLQKEREYTKEMKMKAEEAKTKIYSLQNQKMELDRRLMEMQSTIDSLKEEQKTIESALEEKQNEIKLLRDKDMDSGNVNPQVIALTATLKQKETEIEDFKQRMESLGRVWSVSTDDPSNLPLNTTVAGSMEQKENTKFSQEDGANPTKGQNRNETESIFSADEDNREEVEDGSKKNGETTLRMDVAGGGQLQKPNSLGENARDEEAAGEMGNHYSKHTVTSGKNGEKNPANAPETINEMDKQEHKSTVTGQLGEVKNPHQDGESQKLQGTHKGGKILEIDDNSRISGLPGRLGHLRRTKGKRWRILARNRLQKKNVNSEVDREASMRSRRFLKEYRDVVRSRDKGKAEREDTETGLRKKMDVRKANLLKHQNSEVTDDTSKWKGIAGRNHPVEGENAMSRNHDIFLAREVPETRGVNGEANTSRQNAKLLKVEEAAHIKQNIDSRDVNADKDGTEEDIGVANREPEREAAANGDFSGDFMSDSEDKEGYKEDTGEPEF